MGAIGRGQERDRRPTEDELQKLFADFDANTRNTMPMTAITQFAIATAMRLDEIVRMTARTISSPSSRTGAGSFVMRASANPARLRFWRTPQKAR